MAKKVAVIVGSLRKESWSLKLAKALMKLAPSSLAMELIDISKLPLYNQDPDDEGHPHQEWTDFREKMKQFDAVLFVTPEYNRSVPAPLKNAFVFSFAIFDSASNNLDTSAMYASGCCIQGISKKTKD
jgi:chromate reductase